MVDLNSNCRYAFIVLNFYVVVVVLRFFEESSFASLRTSQCRAKTQPRENEAPLAFNFSFEGNSKFDMTDSSSNCGGMVAPLHR